MMELMDRGADIVYGQRATRGSETWFKRLTAAAFYRLMARLTDVRIPLDTGDFRLMNRRSVDVLNSMPEQHRFIRGMVSWIGFTQVPIQYERHARFAGTTKYPLKKMVRFALDAITGFSVRPLRLTAYFGMAFAVFGLALLGHALHVWLAERTVAGWTSLMAAILIIGSVQLLVLGVIGEYLGRLYMEAKRRPLFIIERVVGGGRPATRQDSPAWLETSQPAAAEAAEPPLTR
jgi:dolichol-phosphate mannosyltransferase